MRHASDRKWLFERRVDTWTHLRVDDNSVSIGRGLPAIASLGSRSLQGSPDVAKGGGRGGCVGTPNQY